MTTIQQLEKQINILTKQLKEMIGNETEYEKIWDKHVDLLRQIDKLKYNEKSN